VIRRTRKGRFEGRRAFVIGAGGGLGAAIGRELESRGAVVAAGLRDPSKARETWSGGCLRIDAVDGGSVEEAAREIAAGGGVDYVVNAAGCDVRKSLAAHTAEEIDRILATDLRGPILITRAFLPAMVERGSGAIMHLGGFADGRLAFPYYSVDAAARAGLRSFAESVNREIAGRGPVLCFFSPAVADTEAERPYHGLWRTLGVKPVPAGDVARAAAEALESAAAVRVMGGLATAMLAGINALWPRAADALILRRYSRALEAEFG
jgi:NADP-dependent 3-hydroxy acid dehydrogenase YdfG